VPPPVSSDEHDGGAIATKKARFRPIAIDKVARAEAAEDAIQAALRKLDEQGGVESAVMNEIPGREARVRYKRDGNGEMVFAAIDLVQAAKGCGYKTAQKTVWDIARGYYGVGLDDSAEVEGDPLHFRRIIFGGQGARPTLCVTIEKAVELVALLPGSEVAEEMRRKCAETLVRVTGGDLRLIDEVIANRRLQEYLAAKDPENPIRAAGESAEKGRKRSFDEVRGGVEILSERISEQQLALQKLGEEQQLALRKLGEEQQLALRGIAEALQEHRRSQSGALTLAMSELDARSSRRGAARRGTPSGTRSTARGPCSGTGWPEARRTSSRAPRSGTSSASCAAAHPPSSTGLYSATPGSTPRASRAGGPGR